MKFKENKIKVGMVIHRPTEEDGIALLEHLDSDDYISQLASLDTINGILERFKLVKDGSSCGDWNLNR